MLRCRETRRASQPRAGRRGPVQRSWRLWIEGPTLRQRRLPWWGVVLTARAAARLSCTTPHREHPDLSETRASFARSSHDRAWDRPAGPWLAATSSPGGCGMPSVGASESPNRRSSFSFSHRQECILHSCWVRSLSPERNAVRDLRKRPRHLAGGLTGPPPPLLFTAVIDEVTIVALPLPQGLPASCVSTQLWLP